MNDILVRIITSPFFIWGTIALMVVILGNNMFTSIRKRLQRDDELEKQKQEVEHLKSLPLPVNRTKALLEKIVIKLEELSANAKEKATEALIHKGNKKPSSYPYGVPTTRQADWAKWKKCYVIIKPMRTQGASLEEIKSNIENDHRDLLLPSSIDTLTNILKAGDEGLLNEFPPKIITPE